MPWNVAEKTKGLSRWKDPQAHRQEGWGRTQCNRYWNPAGCFADTDEPTLENAKDQAQLQQSCEEQRTPTSWFQSFRSSQPYGASMQAEVQSREIQLESRNNPLHLSSTGPPARRRPCTGGTVPRCGNNWTSLCKRMRLNASLTPHTKMTQINANRPKCKTWNNTNLRKHRSKSSWPWAREGFLRHETYSMSNNRKN